VSNGVDQHQHAEQHQRSADNDAQLHRWGTRPNQGSRHLRSKAMTGSHAMSRIFIGVTPPR